MIISKIRQKLHNLSEKYYSQLHVIEAKAKSLLEYSQGGAHLTFTPHGLSHISAVEQNYDWLITEEDLETFNASELFCLIIATFFHDAMMIPQRLGDEAAAREDHAKRANEFLTRNSESLGLSIHEAYAISQVILAHAVYDFSKIPEKVVLGSEKVDLRKLGACLSLADISHADSSRAPEIVLKHLELDEDSKFHWRRHMQISGITREDDVVLMSALTFSEAGCQAVEDYKKAIESQLKIVRPYFHSILKPIKRVELIKKRLESPLDQTLQFQTNTPAILKLLIEGVYDREDVFVRELVQNSLDSCLLRRAKEQRRNVEYEPQILLTIFREKGKYRALRIDDNGIGMDLNDVQDTVLWIGSSISSKSDIIELLQQTLGKNLIASFGIGLLSCFKASNNIRVSTLKKNETALKFILTGVSDSIKPEKALDNFVGTTIVVELNDATAAHIDLKEAINYYFRMVRQVTLKMLEFEWSEDLINFQRENLFKIAITESKPISPWRYSHPSKNSSVEIQGEDFSGSIWFSEMEISKLQNLEGNVDILNEGVFVINEPSSKWLPKHLLFCDAVFNFSSRSISLPAGRDRVIRDTKYKLKIGDILEKSYRLIDFLVEMTQHDNLTNRDFASLILTYIYMEADEESTNRLLKHLDDYNVRLFKSTDRISLNKLINLKYPVYIQYSVGRWVDELTVIDGKQLYHKTDDFVDLQATILAQENHYVISAIREDSAKRIIEAELIKAYFKFFKSKIIDLTKVNVIEGKRRSKQVPNFVRDHIGTSVKFVKIAGLPNRRAWKVGNNLWINLANSKMKAMYEHLQSGNLDQYKMQLIVALFGILNYELDKSLTILEDLIGGFASNI